jgi:hypothetical protein
MANFINGTFNIGTDMSVTVIDNSTGAPIDLGGELVEFSADQTVNVITSEPISNRGFEQDRLEYKGWTGKIMIDRATGAIEKLQMAMEADYHARNPQRTFTITQTVFNPKDQSTDIFQYQYCVMHMTKGAPYKKGQKVDIELSFKAQQGIVIQ